MKLLTPKPTWAAILLATPLLAADARFEVSSIKPNTSGAFASRFTAAHGTLSGTNVVLKLLIGMAYGVDGFLIEGAPGWMNTERFDIQAKAGSDATREEMMPMLRALLEDRFQLKAHRETKEAPIFVLAVAKSGPKFAKLKEGRCPPADPKSPPCGVIGSGANGMNRTMDSLGTGMAVWARTLSLVLGRTVVDETGLEGAFDAMHLEYAPENTDGSPSIFTAVQEQLGLKLEAGKGPVDSLVIERIEKPSGN